MSLIVGSYTATVVPSVGSARITWLITRKGVVVGSMAAGTPGYGERVICSMRALVWAGPIPKGCSDPKSPHYGMAFDTSLHESLEGALQDFAKRADRLIAWRESLDKVPGHPLD